MTAPRIPGYTADDLESLTPDELSALESSEGDNEEELNAIVGEDEDAPAATDASTPADAVPAAGDAGDEPAAEALTPAAYTAEAPADAAAQLEALKASKAAAKLEDRAALKDLHDGKIDFATYEAVKSRADDLIEAANDQIGDLNRAISKAEISAEMTQQEALRAWNGEVSAMMKAGKAEGLDYANDVALNKELDGLVKVFGREAIESGMSDAGLVASKWALAQAHSVMRVRHAAKLVAAPAAATAKPAPGAPRHNLTTLGAMPNADRALVDNDVITKMGLLSGDDIERAMAGLSNAEMQKLMDGVSV